MLKIFYHSLLWKKSVQVFKQKRKACRVQSPDDVLGHLGGTTGEEMHRVPPTSVLPTHCQPCFSTFELSNFGTLNIQVIGVVSTLWLIRSLCTACRHTMMPRCWDIVEVLHTIYIYIYIQSVESASTLKQNNNNNNNMVILVSNK